MAVNQKFFPDLHRSILFLFCLSFPLAGNPSLIKKDSGLILDKARTRAGITDPRPRNSDSE
jgi:hypothetical protein